MNSTSQLGYLERISEVTGRLTGELDDRKAVSLVVESLSALYEEEHEGELSEAAVLTSRILADLTIRFGHGGIRREKELSLMEETEVELQKMHQQLLKKNMVLRERTMIDELTSLFNRRYFERNLYYDFERYKRYGRPFGVVLFDVDYFKNINDTYGHSIGDEILKHLANLAKGTVRRADMVARWGGEEFVLLLPETNRDGAAITAERLRKNVMDAPLMTDKGLVEATISLGVLAVDEGFSGDSESVMRSVDRALYRAKENGRNRFELAS